MEVGKTLRITTRKAWRTWLAKSHASRKEIWLVYPLKHTGKRRIPYNDAVENKRSASAGSIALSRRSKQPSNKEDWTCLKEDSLTS